jgi:hypothetical protein
MNFKQILLAGLAGLACAWAFRADAGDVLPLADGWRFLQGDVLGAEQPHYNDSHWAVVTVPNDWSIGEPFSAANAAGGAFLPTGVAWYRNHFSLPAEALERRVYVEFDGVVRSCDVWINGRHLGHQPNGDGGFRYELPDTMLGFGNGTNNVLAVCADTSEPADPLWYAGGGIYRPVRLVIVDAVHLAGNGVVAIAPKISGGQATVEVETTVTNEFDGPAEVSVLTTLLAPDGEPVGAVESSLTVAGGALAKVEQPMAFANPLAWNFREPLLYQAISKLRVEGTDADERTTLFALREAHFADDTNVWLNGEAVPLKGVRLHGDGGAFGMAVPFSIWEARLKTLKSLGVNAVCLMHTVPAASFQESCDRLGLLLISEQAPGAELFRWTGMDYLGESSRWPDVGHASGLLDRTGAIHPVGWERGGAWSDAPMLAMVRRGSAAGTGASDTGEASDEWRNRNLLNDWTPEDLKPHTEDVEVYSNCKEVELFLNGKSLGRKGIAAGAAPRDWQVPFVPGVLRAVARGEKGRAVLTNELHTAGRAARIVLGTDAKSVSADWNDVALVRAAIVDVKGTTVPRASDLISFTLSGPGVIAAVDNGDETSHESFQATSRHAFQGGCAVFVRAGAAAGRIKLTASSVGLKAGSVGLWVSPAKKEPAINY